MKAASIFHLVIGLFIIFLVFCVALMPLQRAQAQDNSYLEPFEKFSREELSQMVAPIALYPDALLSQVLMASTYPIEVIEADRWVRRNPEMKGEALDAVLLDKDWDPSVKAICHFPSILALMSERVTETTNLGNAFIAQEAEVMEMVQELRARAYARGNLTTTSQQKVVVEKETIIIEPASPTVIYVPYYDPSYVYGPWWYPAYRPYYWGPSGINIGAGVSYWPGIYFGFAFGTWSYFDWHHHNIYINVHKRPKYVRHDRWRSKPGRWTHSPRHRRGVAYRDKTTARKYGQYHNRSRVIRRNTRGFPESGDRDRNRVDDRTRINREKRGDNRTTIDRDRQERQRIDQDKQERARIEPDRQERQRVKQDRQKRVRVEPDRQSRQRADSERRTRKRVESQQQQRSQDNVFNRVEDGRSERQSSKRGRVSRQGRANDSRNRGRNRR